MPYTKTTWVDGSAPAISASNLNKIEQGIADSLRLDGTTTMTGQLVTVAGTYAIPAIAPTGDSNNGIYFPAADTIAFTTVGSERARFTSTGNFGVGTTTSADITSLITISKTTTNASDPVLSIKGTLGTGSAGHAIEFKQHTTYSTGFIACNATGGGAGTALIFGTSTSYGTSDATEKMRIDRLGNVGIGTSAPARLLEVSSSGNTYQRLISTTDSIVGLEFYSNGTQKGLITGDSNGLLLSSVTSTPIIFSTSATERMRIGITGNIGLGVSGNISNKVTVASDLAVIETDSANTSAIKLDFASSVSRIRSTINGTGTQYPMGFFIGGTQIMQIETGGTVRPATNNSYDLGSSTYRWATIYSQNALNVSDARLKTDVQDSTLGLDFIESLRPVQYKFIEGRNEVTTDENDEQVIIPIAGVRTHFGLIAQEVKQALPSELDFAGWCLADKNDADSLQSLGYTELIAPMIKAIQELKAEVESLKTQLNGWRL